MNQRIQGILIGLGIGALMLGAQAMTYNEEPAKPSFPSDVCRAVMPQDLGEKVIIWLRPNGDGGYSLDWEKHQLVSSGMASVPVSKD